jgi:hypothetical protein
MTQSALDLGLEEFGNGHYTKFGMVSRFVP